MQVPQVVPSAATAGPPPEIVAGGGIRDDERCYSPPPVAQTRRHLDEESRTWLVDLRSSGNVQDAAVERLHAPLLRAACSRSPAAPHAPEPPRHELEDIALGAADDALMSVLSRSTTSAARVGSRRGSTSSRLTRRRRSCAGAHGRDARCRSNPRRGACSRASPAVQRTRSRRRAPDEPQGRHRNRSHAAPARRARRAGPERRPDRRPRRADGDDARRALQDTARRAASSATISATGWR